MATFKLIISADHEIFGNGSGDVNHCMVKPTKKLQEIADKYGAKITLFTDVCEYWVFEKEKPDWANAIKSQWVDFIKNGHDVQLHLHPQWLNYKYQNEFIVDNSLWRLPNVKNSNNDFKLTIFQLLEKGKITLESSLLETNQNYSCNTFRAGGWCIQPEQEILEALIALNFKIDSTVAPGNSNPNPHSWFNFENAPNLPFWFVKDSVLKKESNGILEMPITTIKPDFFTNLYLLIEKVLQKHPKKPENCIGKAGLGKKSKISKIIEALKPSPKMLNFSDATTAKEMIYIAKKYIQKFDSQKGDIPLVMIGHPKTFGNYEAFDEFLKWASSNPKIEFSLYSDLNIETA